MKRFSHGIPSSRVLPLLFLVLLVAGCGGSGSGSSSGSQSNSGPSGTSSSIESIVVSPGTLRVDEGGSGTVALDVRLSDGSTGRVSEGVSWVAEDANIARVEGDPRGDRAVIRGEDFGTARFRAEYAGRTASFDVDVGRLEIEPNALTLPVGMEKALTVRAVFAGGRGMDVTNEVEWSASDADVGAAEVEGSGAWLYAKSPGSSVIQAEWESMRAASKLTVEAHEPPGDGDGDGDGDPDAVSLSVEPETVRLDPGENRELRAFASSSDGIENVTSDVTWSSNNDSVASVEQGSVLAVNPGEAAIVASWQGESATAHVAVIDDAADGPSDLAVSARPNTLVKSESLLPVIQARLVFADSNTGEADGRIAVFGVDAPHEVAPEKVAFVDGSAQATLTPNVDSAPETIAVSVDASEGSAELIGSTNVTVVESFREILNPAGDTERSEGSDQVTFELQLYNSSNRSFDIVDFSLWEKSRQVKLREVTREGERIRPAGRGRISATLSLAGDESDIVGRVTLSDDATGETFELEYEFRDVQDL